jgi:hypothetical protein
MALTRFNTAALRIIEKLFPIFWTFLFPEVRRRVTLATPEKIQVERGGAWLVQAINCGTQKRSVAVRPTVSLAPVTRS